MPHPLRARHVLQLAAAILIVLLVPAPLSTAAAAGHSPSMATAADSAAVLYALEADLNAHDEDAVVGRFTADAHLTDGAVYLGTDQVRAWARAAIADDVWLELADAPEIGPTSGQPLVGDWAVAPVALSRAWYRDLGVNPLRGVLAAIVQDARIGYLSIRPDLLWRRDFRTAHAARLPPCPAGPGAVPMPATARSCG